MFVDTHCHLHDLEFFTPEQQIDFLHDAQSHKVEKIICIGTNPADSKVAADFAQKHPNVFWTYGVHPEFASRYTKTELAIDKSGSRENSILFSRDHLVAIGEIGLDYHYEPYDRSAQIKLFEQMLQLALDLKLPVSLHIREAFDDAFAVLANFSDLRGVVHSFTGSKRELKTALDRGFYIGVNGLATYATLPLPPLDRILLETDAPFLTPVPFRGTINKPGYVQLVAAYLAGKMGVAEVEIMEQTTQNAQNLFQI